MSNNEVMELLTLIGIKCYGIRHSSGKTKALPSDIVILIFFGLSSTRGINQSVACPDLGGRQKMKKVELVQVQSFSMTDSSMESRRES